MMNELKLTEKELDALNISIYGSILRNSEFLKSIEGDENFKSTYEYYTKQNSLLNSARDSLLHWGALTFGWYVD